ncbi:Arginase-agmatinase-formimionoglutamate hydrolase protein [Haloplasma contractile SSD-17B]|uniref:Arginase-agmatinase-formimionoglutamate hydrolase protein n=2 Tax=Haloplasma TaxID=471824 RepID=U2EB52_9MOLU|nr:Arginase-agmatinase-formimionoglutamate hydrolase protein [Haloplasma contractile SSD-17B]
MMMNKSTMTFIGCEEEFDDAKLVLFGAPFDGTTSFRPGTRFAPTVIRNESYGLETYSPYQDRDLEDSKVFDAGDLELTFGNPKRVLDTIEAFTRKIVEAKKLPVMIGGEHLLSYSPIKVLSETYEDLHIIQLDAHTDLRDDYAGEKLSHATVMKRAWEFVGDGRIYQFGIRSGLKEEFKWAETHTQLNKFTLEGLKEAVASLKGKPVYITIDLDVLDPSVFPGTGTPEPGGITFHDLQDAILMFRDLNVVGADVVELSPHYDQTGKSTAVACKTLRELMLAITK